MRPLALVTGGNRGIGKETCRQLLTRGLEVILTARNPESGAKAATELSTLFEHIHFHPLDVNVATLRAKLAEKIESDFGRLDVLINNAGIMPEKELEKQGTYQHAGLPDESQLLSTIQTNALSAYMLSKSCWQLLRNAQGQIINVSSGLGQMDSMQGGYVGYRVSKAALNAFTLIMADEGNYDKIRVNSVCPGWTQTEMGGEGAVQTVEQGADTIAWLALETHDFNGSFFQNRKKISW